MGMNHSVESTIAYRLKKSWEDWEAACILADARSYSAVMNRLYYAAFHAVSALLFQGGIKHKVHNGAKAMFETHFVKLGIVSVEWGRFYSMLFTDRNESDYEDFVVFDAEDVLPLIPETAEFIQLVRSLIDKS
ncbi:HEPN domain-containing protein [Fibrella sp. HMF5335]|uniref:HEPN domain-containing protein n=1 Tax=Fibrella rubiginis TaxID=2817060 RepID=A0A939GGY7_9BACT|nr:HEPN domain-containing protein [Fibrella rubiginis]MBO0936302.1 HEPN domain-containing protein [Fibrella rubiginis]